jgi:BioD-like phosphotransacetylase family protein
MKNLYILSKESAGKTALCAGLGKKLVNYGKKVGYFIPVHLSEDTKRKDYKEIEFLKEILGLEDPSNEISPVVLSGSELWEKLTNSPEEFTQKMRKNYERVARNRDVVIMEGLGGLSIDNVSTLASYRIAEALDSKVIIILQDSSTLTPADIARVAGELKQKLLGIVVNLAPESRIEQKKRELVDSFQKEGIKILGVLPELRNLLGFSVKQLSELLRGEVLTCPEETDKLVANVMIGALTIDSGVSYFSRKRDKAVIVRGERADMQLAVLQTSTNCLVLTDNIEPLETVIFEAERKHVPLVVVPGNIIDTIASVEQAIGCPAFSGSEKLKQFEEILNQHLDFAFIQSELGL